MGVVVAAVVVLAAAQVAADEFAYSPAGVLVAGSGSGRVDETLYVPAMRFPIEEAPAYANSQVWGRGGSEGPGGSQCDVANFSYPWWDNYCESRSWDMPLCPSGTGHQGQDIRAASCSANVHWAVAAEAGTITAIGSYSVTLMADGGTRHRYLHLANSSLQVAVGDRVERGERIGRVSNEFGGTPTTVHLHYDLFQNVAGVGGVYVPTYMSLVRSYEDLLGAPAAGCEPLGEDGGVIDDGDRCVELLGPVASWRYVTGAGHADDLRWTYAWDRPRSNWADYEIALSEAGRYEVAVYVDGAWAQSQQARYDIRAAGSERSVVVDQSAFDGWAPLGEFTFAADGNEWIRVGDDSGEDYALRRQLVVDAVRLIRVRDAVEDVGVVDAGSGDDAGEADAGTPDAGEADVAADAAIDSELDAADAFVNDASDVSGTTDVLEDAGPSEDAAADVWRDVRQGGDVRELPDGRAEVRTGCSAGGVFGGVPWSALLALGVGIVRRRRGRSLRA